MKNIMDNKLMVYVLTHKTPPYGLIQDDWHCPLQVGADLSEEDVCELKDNTGNNISIYNPFFCETTGHYWIWKNAEKSDFVGVEHYRRHFDLERDEILNILKKCDIIAPKPLVIGVTVEKQYEICHIPEDIHKVEDIINKLCVCKMIQSDVIMKELISYNELWSDGTETLSKDIYEHLFV